MRTGDIFDRDVESTVIYAQLHGRERFQRRIARMSQFLGASQVIDQPDSCQVSPVPLPALYAFGEIVRVTGLVKLHPRLVNMNMRNASRPFNAISITAFSTPNVPARSVTSLYGQLLRTAQGGPWPARNFLHCPEVLNVILAEEVSWKPFRGKTPVAGQMTVMASAQEHIFEYRNGKLPRGDAQRLSWESRMHRLATEVRWEVLNRRPPSGGSENHRRDARDVAERGYDLRVDMLHGFVLFAQPLSIREWNERRAAFGLPCI